MARPVIATRVAGCTVVVDEGKTGLLCEVASAGSLADSMMRFLELSAAKRADMGRAGQNKMAREFDQSIVVQAYLAAIDALCDVHKTEKPAACANQPTAKDGL